MKRGIGVMFLSAMLATTGAGVAQARFAPPLGDFGSQAPPPGKLAPKGNVTKVVAGVRSMGGSGGYAPLVSWSARNQRGAAVTGDRCRIEITFPGQRWPMYKSTACQGSRGFPNRRYTEAARYPITVLERTSGAYATVTFDVV
ncbi:MAG: hypothetical protein QM728_09935 [Gordonia sp. (in: high G+C Gram-positive bacteria)]|uniref:hypothetical protein n=1 Tax=Gordonia sp. (in: high G+C Gram-positive bacteria) TaxID=84139 RepID=UPI0039E2B4BB